MLLMPLVALCADVDLRSGLSCNIKSHLAVLANIEINRLGCWGFFKGCLAPRIAGRKWERYKMDNYEHHYDMSCAANVWGPRFFDIFLPWLRYEGTEGHEKSPFLGSPMQMPQMPHIPGMGFPTPSRQMQVGFGN